MAEVFSWLEMAGIAKEALLSGIFGGLLGLLKSVGR